MSARASDPKLWRIEVVIRNISGELPRAGEGVLTIDFEDETALTNGYSALESGMKNPLEQSLILRNERDERLAFNPHHYAYHRAFVDHDGPRQPPSCRWLLPSKGLGRRRR